MRIVSYIFWMSIILLGVSVAAMNSRSVEIHYYFGQTNVYLPLLLLVELAVGALLGVIAMLPQVLKLKSSLRKSRQLNKRREDERQALKPTEKGTEECYCLIRCYCFR